MVRFDPYISTGGSAPHAPPPPPPSGYPGAYPTAPPPSAYPPGAIPPGAYSGAHYHLGSGDVESNNSAIAAETGVTVDTAEVSVRLGFLRKVYTLLTLSLMVTIGISAAFCFIIPVRDLLARNPWLVIVGFVIGFASFLPLACLRLKAPWNAVLFCVFILGWSLAIGVICALFFARGWGAVVLQAFIGTAACFVAITAYCLITKKDFSYLGGFLFGALIALLALTLLTWVSGWLFSSQSRRWLYFIVSILGTLVCIGYLLYDTSIIVTRLGPDDWLIAVISLYTDVTSLFMYLLAMLSIIQN